MFRSGDPSCCKGAAPASIPRARRRTGALAAGLLVAACSPASDWRELEVPGTTLAVRLPCKPDRQQRTVVVAGQPLAMSLQSCQAGDTTYGLATADVGDPARVDAVLTALAESARGAIGAPEPAVAAFAMPGVTPYRGDVRLRLAGRRPDGRAVEESLTLFARGTQVFQATALGEALPDSALAPFLEGLRFRGLSSAP